MRMSEEKTIRYVAIIVGGTSSANLVNIAPKDWLNKRLSSFGLFNIYGVEMPLAKNAIVIM